MAKSSTTHQPKGRKRCVWTKRRQLAGKGDAARTAIAQEALELTRPQAHAAE
jgi:hypothetical protein